MTCLRVEAHSLGMRNSKGESIVWPAAGTRRNTLQAGVKQLKDEWRAKQVVADPGANNGFKQQEKNEHGEVICGR
jgi:hypothetical protein